jgi:hypothetical protein
VSRLGCQQEPPPRASRHDLALCAPLGGALAIRDPARFRPRAGLAAFDPPIFRCDGGASDPNARSRRRPTERAGRHLEPRTAKRLLQLHTTHGHAHERAIFALLTGVPVTSFPAPASLRPHMRGGEPRVPDRLEDRTPISCEWAEKDHTGRRAEPKAEVDAPRSRFLGAGPGAAQPPKRICVRSGVLQSLPLSLSEHPLVVNAVSTAELEFPSDSVIRRRLPVSAVTFSTAPTHRPILSNRVGCRPPTFRLPREGRQLLGSRGAFHRLESMCTGIAPSAFIDRSSDHAGALSGSPSPRGR